MAWRKWKLLHIEAEGPKIGTELERQLEIIYRELREAEQDFDAAMCVDAMVNVFPAATTTTRRWTRWPRGCATPAWSHWIPASATTTTTCWRQGGSCRRRRERRRVAHQPDQAEHRADHDQDGERPPHQELPAALQELRVLAVASMLEHGGRTTPFGPAARGVLPRP